LSSIGVERARALVLAHGWNATAYQILNPGIELWFAAAGDAVVGFVHRHGVRVVAGAPVCSESRLEEISEEFAHAAARAGSEVCYFCAESRLETVCRGAGGHAFVLLGAQPMWDVARWNEVTLAHASLRAQLNRARHKRVEVSEWTAGRAKGHPGLHRCLEEWLATRGLPPLHFLIEPVPLDRLEDRRLFVASRGSETLGFLVASPVPARRGWLVEQLVRGRGAPNGTSELLIDSALRALGSAGGRFATLGLAPLSRRAMSPATGNPVWLEACLRLARAHGHRFYNFGGLEAFKAKFRPTWWDPVFAIARAPSFSPVMLYAVAAAFTRGSPVLALARGVARAGRTELRWLAGAGPNS
jgi:phosphatidylglycerol lysyltransferase